MSTRSGELFDQGLDFFSTVITRLKEDDWGATNTVRRLDRSRSARSPRELRVGCDEPHAGPPADVA
jgi:hypothetical protein